MKVIIGRTGTQWFPIEDKQWNVSGEHAEIDVNPKTGIWTLKDLDSKNGTYIRDETTGQLRRVSQIKINPMTFICLGGDNKHGCCFYARQIEHPNDRFREEMRYLKRKDDEFEQETTKVKKKLKNIRVWQALASAVSMFLIYVFANKIDELFDMLLGFSIPNATLMRMIVVVPLIVVIFEWIRSKIDKLEDINKRRELFNQCPNPQCSKHIPHKSRSFHQCRNS